MKDYLNLGSTPAAEDCAQVGAPDYHEKSKKELRAYINQIIRKFGRPPLHGDLVIKSFPHDFGTYHEVCVVFDDEEDASTDYAYKVEEELPEYWDDEAKKELGQANV